MKKHLRELQKSLNNGKTVRRRNVGYRKFRHSYHSRAAHNDPIEFVKEVQHDYDKYSKEIHRDGYWMYKAPNYYFKYSVIIPERRATNFLLQKLHRTLLANYDDLIFSVGRKIQNGYW